MSYHSVEITKKDYKDFINLPWKIYRGNPYWIPPLKLDIKQKLNPKKNPFFEYGKIKLFGVVDEKNTLVGRGASIINPRHNKRYLDKTGFFGLFECIKDTDAAKKLMDCIIHDLKINNRDKVVGPVNFTTNDESGILVEGFDSSPVFMINYSPSYYNALLLACGFKKETDLFSYKWLMEHTYPEKYKFLINSLRERAQIQIRHIDRSQLDRELEIFGKIYNSSFDGVWGFVPLTSAEIADMGRGFKLIADDDLILLAELRGKPIGFCLTLPDINVVLKELDGHILPFGFFKLLIKIKY